jgi:hypothetical protein
MRVVGKRGALTDWHGVRTVECTDYESSKEPLQKKDDKRENSRCAEKVSDQSFDKCFVRTHWVRSSSNVDAAYSKRASV